MSSTTTPAQPSAAEQLITVKVLYDDNNRRFRLPLKDLRASVFPQKLRTLLGVPADVNVILERYSDSAGSYIRLYSDNAVVYKQLYRAAKAKSKLRIKVTTVDLPAPTAPEVTQPADQPTTAQPPVARPSYLDTVLSSPIPVALPETLPYLTRGPAPTGEVGAQETETSDQPQHREFEMEHDKLHFPVISHNSPNGMFVIDCNNCGRSIANEHFHCSICENGDYDLCPECVDAGGSCRGEGHWLIKRVVDDGIVTNSTTETLPLRETPVQQSESKAPAEQMPVAAAKKLNNCTRPDVADKGGENAMCNGCCRENDTRTMVRCNECEDYDLCFRCLLRNKHGHHPAHSFQLGSDHAYCLKNLITARCSPGRQFKHAAVCDGCDSRIVGIRHKCLSCPDWDYCKDCIKTASQTHSAHRFVPIYDVIAEPPRVQEIHYGIFCDGPLCKNKPAQSYITGVRYKCAVCDDTDFCANCEALPNTHHNRTHPLIKFKTPVRNVTVSTVGDDGLTGRITLGDQSNVFANPSAATLEGGAQEKHLAEEKPPVEVEASQPAEKMELLPLATEVVSAVRDDPVSDFQGFYIRDTVTDGTRFLPNTTFQQTWTLYNPGPRAWPTGSDVRFVGGDTMFDVDANHPSSVESIRSAMESNKLTAPVEPGQSADFTVTLRTPSREGTAISYWRLKLPNGMPIGHRLWCDVQVKASAPTYSEPAPMEKAETPTPCEAPATASPEPSSSGMIFPKLDKESPETSMHEAAAGAPQPAPQAPTLTNPSERDVLEEVESLTLDDADTETGFLTDDEYDVLDASDQECVEAKQSAN